MTSKEALQSIRDFHNEVVYCKHRNYIKNIFEKELDIIEKDLEILEILKSYMSIETEIFENENNEVVEYEYIAFNNGDLDIENKEEYNKIKEWLQGK